MPMETRTLSKFVETLPMGRIQTQNQGKNFKVKKVLMIEDDPEMSELIQSQLTSQGHVSMDVAQDPFEAINLMSEKYYDMIILDWGLPALTGAETLLQADRSFDLDPTLPARWDQSKTPVVIFSSSKKTKCLPRKTKHFDYVGFISKIQPLDKIISGISKCIEQAGQKTNSLLRPQLVS